ncbi:unnamed protein product [Calypogeia fissa]
MSSFSSVCQQQSVWLINPAGNGNGGKERGQGRRRIQVASTVSAAWKGWGELVGFRSRVQCSGVCSSQGGRSIRSGSDRIKIANSTFFKSRAELGLHVQGLGAGSRFQPIIRRKSRNIGQQRIRCSNAQSSTENEAEIDSRNSVEEEDPITKLLRENPSQVEPRYMVGNKFYTLKEKMLLQRPLWKKLALALSSRSSSKASDVEISERKKEEATETEAEAEPSTSASAANPVYLSDLLRQYKGNLFVPEEAFEERVSELEQFNRSLDALPEMTFEDCLKYIKSDNVKLLTSRGIPFANGGYVYWDFVVELEEVPGEKALQHRKWAMHLSEDEAQTILKEYKGPQREVETNFTPYMMRPTRVPHPIASSVSSRLVTELGVFVSITSALAMAAGGVAVNISLSVFGTGRFLVVQVIWPILHPLLRPFATLATNISNGTWSIVVAVFSGKKGPGWLVAEGIRLWKTGVLFSSARTLSAILFVLIAMAALAKFTLTRRPKDFTKWDLWQAIEFGHSKPQARVEGTTGIGFSDVAGIDDVVKELQELVSYLKDPERFNRMGTRPPHGVLLEGPPGCGKTLLAKAIAGEAEVPFYQMAGSEFVEVLVGVGAARVRDLFKRAKVNRPSVVFIDEIDALGAIRHGAAGDEGMDSYHAGAQERETTLNQLLIELDGFDTGKGVVFLGATNRMDMLDPALLRPGRFDRKIAIRPPRAKGRLEILRVHAKAVKLDDSVDLWLYAKNLPGWSGAELAQLLQEAALVAVRHGGTRIVRHDMDQALDRLTMGPERLGLGRRQPVHRRMAAHEVGLAMTSHLLRRLENAQIEFADRVSIVPRGETIARTIFDKLEDEAYMFERRPTLIHRMQVMLGGRAAEEVMYGQNTSTFSVQHLPDASWLARKMVSIWNMEGDIAIRGDLNPWAQSESFTGPPLEFEGGLYDNYGFHEKSLNYDLVDDVASRSKALLDKVYQQTLRLLKDHKAALSKAIYVVMEKEELFGEELELILDHYPASVSPQSVEEEEEPGALPSENDAPKALPGSSEWESSENLSMQSESTGSRDETVEKWTLTGVRSMDPGEVERLRVGSSSSGDESGSADGSRWVERQSKPNGNGDGQRKEQPLDRGESWGSSLEVGDVAATNRSGFGESPPDASIAASVSRTGKNDIHD